LIVKIVVDGFPVPAARPRFARVGAFVKTYNPGHVGKYRERLQAEASTRMKGLKPLDGPLKMNVLCVMPIVSGINKRDYALAVRGLLPHIKKPDCSNLLKNFEDALNGIVYIDDARLSEVTIRKIYGEKPRVEITVEEMTPNESLFA
jgi:Holliday junction resolvase RusA-like endonuclease